MVSENFEEARDWEELLEKKVKQLKERDQELVCLNKKLQSHKEEIKYLEEDVHCKKKQLERVEEQLKRVDRKNLELMNSNRDLRRRLEDAEKKVRQVAVKDLPEKDEKLKHDRYILELRERIKIEETERQRVRHELEKEKEAEKEFFEFQEFKRRMTSSNN